MKKALILAAAFLGTAFTANANSLVTSWSTSVWSYVAQPDYNNNASPDYLKIYAANGSDATLTSSVPPSAYPSLQLMDGIFYSHMTPVTLTGNISNALSNLTQITFDIVATASFAATINSFGLSFNGDSQVYVASSHSAPVPADPAVTPVGTFNMDKITVSWNISELGLTVPIDSIQFVLPAGMFVGIADITVTQVSAVPEPSTYALLAGAFGLAAVVIARRRRA